VIGAIISVDPDALTTDKEDYLLVRLIDG